MSKKPGRIIKCMWFFVFINAFPLNAQMLQDTNCLKLIKKNIDYTYNFQFDNAGKVYEEVSHLYPEHPIVYLLRGIMTYWKNYPLVNINPSHIPFEDDMRKCIKLAEADHNSVYETEYLLANLCARGMLLMFYADNDLSINVIPLATSTYKYIRRSFDFNKSNSDLNFFTGLYNYYREAYPKIYPIYNTLDFVFPSGDLENGIKQLQTSARYSLLLRAESYLSLAWIYLYFENKYPESLYYSKTLHELYPDNPEYLTLYIKSLLLLKKYDEAEIQMSASEQKTKNLYQAQITIFKGILLEKKDHNYRVARELYKKGITDIAFFWEYGNEYAAYAYYGLSRISEANGDKQESRTYRKMATKLSDFKSINFDN